MEIIIIIALNIIDHLLLVISIITDSSKHNVKQLYNEWFNCNVVICPPAVVQNTMSSSYNEKIMV